MPYFVYILFSEKDKKLYVGCTTDLDRRQKAHNFGKVQATRDRRPVKLIYSEEYQNKAEAFNRERFLKSLWGARLKKKILCEYINKIGHTNIG